MPLDDVLKARDQGDKVDLHLHLKQHHVDLLDRLRERYNCSRSAVVEALLDEYAAAPVEKQPKKGKL